MKNIYLIITLVILITGAFWAGTQKSLKNQPGVVNASPTPSADEALAAQVFPESGVQLPVKWGDLGQQLVAQGVIDVAKLESIYAARGGLGDGEKALLTKSDNDNLKIDTNNANFILNLLWAFGLGNQNRVLTAGPMVDKQYGGAGNFASTGGWTLSSGTAMSHYSKHRLVALTDEQQQLVEQIAKNIYRPCCDNSTYFPDCNHGMAMLALLELMAAQGASESDMYKYALAVNSYWFPGTYINVAKYMARQGITWDKVDPKQILGNTYSSASGYKQILSQIEPAQIKSAGGCGV